MPRMTVRQLLLWLAGFVVATCWDRAAYVYLSAHNQFDKQTVEGNPVYRVFYYLGTLYVWGLVGAAIVLAGFVVSRDNRERAAAAVRRGLFVLAAAAAGGAAAEIALRVFRRERPIVAEGWYHFRSFLDRPLSRTDLGLPSSHAAVAFGGAFALGMLIPKYRMIFLLAAAGTAFARILPGAHFLSDCVLGAFVAMVAANALAMWILGKSTVTESNSHPFRVQ